MNDHDHPPVPTTSPVVAAYLARQDRCPVCGEWTSEPPLTSRCRDLHERPAARGRARPRRAG